MVVSDLTVNLFSGFKRDGSRPRFKNDKFPKKKREIQKFSLNPFYPTNWGTAAIMLPPMVSFKKISQKSYANDIPK